MCWAAGIGAQASVLADSVALSQEAATVAQLWQDYLTSKGGQFSSRAGVRSPLWIEAEQREWPVYDLASYYLPDGAIPAVLSIDPVRGLNRDEYRIRTRFRSGEQGLRSPSWWTELVMTVYAVRIGDRWRLANALPRHTRTWHRDTVGPITYVFAPDYPYDVARARRAVAFTDSLAGAFELPPLAPIMYYLTSSVDEVYQIMGLESPVKFGPVGGAAQPINRQLFSGIPAVGEEYRHELAHLVLAPLCCERTSYFVSEGVATWLGGTAGGDFAAATRDLAKFLSAHPKVSLDSLLSGSFSTAQTYPAAAMLVAMVFDAAGIAGIKALFEGGKSPDALRKTLERLLHRRWSAIATEWRDKVMSVASAPKPGL